jgi:hypothetical protein
MKNGFFQRLGALVMTFAILGAGTPVAGYAGIIDTATVVESQQREADLATLSAGLHRADVQEQMVSMGVDPVAVEARLAAMTNSELRQMAEQMEQMPAGGDALAVVGIVFVVLIILELVGVIDIFKRT